MTERTTCTTCHGSGNEPGRDMDCLNCNGSGEVWREPTSAEVRDAARDRAEGMRRSRQRLAPPRWTYPADVRRDF